ncbi:MAG: SpoIID/LytB domain-containing protein, partial [Eubacteriales bacterium]|nr:SpoIID/LytB domain-containing protein [Eubacteriales bacterium]
MRLIESCRIPVAAGALLLCLGALFLFAPVSSTSTEKASGDPMNITVYLAAEGKNVKMSLDEYIVGALAAEMPASYHLEALKAQALAIRTRAYSQARVYGGKGCAEHSGADICSSSAHCQGYIAKNERMKKWGGEFEMYERRLEDCARATKGEYIAYDGKPISVMYHAVSGGVTEDSEAVFASALPYLRSVKSAGEEGMRNFSSSLEFPISEFAEKLSLAFPASALTEDNARDSVYVLSRSLSG